VSSLHGLYGADAVAPRLASMQISIEVLNQNS
jgi:hypothetical protein